ncbi:MAG: hypothetical protein PHN56_03185 [Candidatus Nanoarchaeia archaeon]|nr:hypothetical protein [Candidatus Nanoarchaeia archaeon]
MSTKLYFFALLFLLISTAYSLKCANELQESLGTCINVTYNLINNRGQAYYACSIITDNLWYYNKCTATVATGNIISDNGNIVAEWWSNEANKVSACAGKDGYTCNVNPLFNFKQEQTYIYVGYCDSSEQTCVKCSTQKTELKKFDGTGTVKTSINGAGNGLCEKGCSASQECDEKATGYNIVSAGCTNNCEWQTCGNYNWNSTTNLCHTTCQSNSQCLSSAVCDLVINPNTCKVDSQFPTYSYYFHTDITSTPDNSIIRGDLVMLSAYWTDNLYLSYADLELFTNNEWASYARIENINSQNSWTNYTINTTSFSEEFVNWRITVTDIAGNTNTTPTKSFYVYEKSAKFNITMNYNNLLSFTGWGQIENNLKANNSNNSTFIGEITLIHDGRGINSKYSFKINESLPSTIRIKINNNSNPLTATTLTDSLQNPTWCQSQIRGDVCQIWMWMDLDYGNEPAQYLRQLVIKHESNN